MLHIITCYSSNYWTVNAVNVVALWHWCSKCDSFGWHESKSQVLQKWWQIFCWALRELVSTDSTESCCLTLCYGMHWGIKGGDVGHQVKIKKAKVCCWLNELFNKLLCTCSSHSLWISPGALLGLLAPYRWVLCRSLQDPQELQGRWW